MRYRPELDGLRAIAVCSVILFHAGLGIISGGYLGVDIFFVISGYLITGIIVREISENRFSLWNFYDRRVRRIIPALVVVMALSTLFGFCLMLPDDLENLGQSLVATSLFSNNILLLLTSGYFALEAEFKPLMHTWSLAVEEQYYFVIPLVILTAYKIGGRIGVVTTLLCLCLASLFFCVWAATAMPIANFLLILSRVWELGAGGLAVLLQPRMQKSVDPQTLAGKILTAVGLVMIIVPLFVFDKGSALPSWPTLVPVVGACLVLVFANGDAGPGRLLSLKPVMGVGLISYSAYLFHQPIFAFARIVSIDEPSQGMLLSLVPVVLFFAWMSWRFVERPFRNPKELSFTEVAVGLGAVSVGLVSVGLAMHISSGFLSRWPELVEGDEKFGARQNISYNMEPFNYIDRKFDKGGARPKILIIGDSFGRDFVNGSILV